MFENGCFLRRQKRFKCEQMMNPIKKPRLGLSSVSPPQPTQHSSSGSGSDTDNEVNSRIDETSRMYYQAPLSNEFAITELPANQIENHPSQVYYPSSQATSAGAFPMTELQPAQLDSRQAQQAIYYQAQANSFNMPHHFQSMNQADSQLPIYYQPQSAEFLMNQFQSSQVDSSCLRNSNLWYQ